CGASASRSGVDLVGDGLAGEMNDGDLPVIGTKADEIVLKIRIGLVRAGNPEYVHAFFEVLADGQGGLRQVSGTGRPLLHGSAYGDGNPRYDLRLRGGYEKQESSGEYREVFHAARVSRIGGSENRKFMASAGPFGLRRLKESATRGRA